MQLLAGARVPDPDAAVVGRGDLSAVGREGHAPTQPAPLRNVTCESGTAAGQSLTVPSRLPEAASAPSGPKATQWTNPVWPWKVGALAAVEVPAPDALVLAAGDELPAVGREGQARGRIPGGRPACPPASRCRRSQIRMVLSQPPEATRPAVRTEGDGIDEIDVPAQPMDDRSSGVGEVAEVDDVAAGQREGPAVGRERHGQHAAGPPAIARPRARRRSAASRIRT